MVRILQKCLEIKSSKKNWALWNMLRIIKGASSIVNQQKSLA